MADIIFEDGIAKMAEPEGVIDPARVADALLRATEPAAAPFDPFNQPPDPAMNRAGKPKAQFRNQGTHNIKPADDPQSMLDASESGDLIRLYELMRNRLVEMLTVCESARDAPSLTRAILNVGKEIDSLQAQADEARLKAEAQGDRPLTAAELRAEVFGDES